MEAHVQSPKEPRPDGEVRVNSLEFKTHFSKFLVRMEAGEDIVVCRAGEPVARLTPWVDQRKRRALGAMKGEPWLVMASQIMDEELEGKVDEQVLRDFYGDDYEQTMPLLGEHRDEPA